MARPRGSGPPVDQDLRSSPGYLILSLAQVAGVVASLLAPHPAAGATRFEAQIARVTGLAAQSSPPDLRRAFTGKRMRLMGLRSFCCGSEGLTSNRIHPATAGSVLHGLRTVFGCEFVDDALRANSRQAHSLSHPPRADSSTHRRRKIVEPTDPNAIWTHLGQLPLQVLRAVEALNERAPGREPAEALGPAAPLYRALSEANLNYHDLVRIVRRHPANPAPSALDDVLSRRLPAVQALAEQYRASGLQSIALFGSAVRRAETPDSDLDFLVAFTGQAKERVLYDYLDKLSMDLARIVGRRTDAVPLEFFPQHARRTVSTGAVQLWRQEQP